MSRGVVLPLVTLLAGCVASPSRVETPRAPSLALAAGVEVHVRPAGDPGWLELPDVVSGPSALGPHEGWAFLGAGPGRVLELEDAWVYRVTFSAAEVPVEQLVRQLGASPQLQAAFVSDAAALSIADLEALAGCASLRALTLQGAAGLGRDGLAALARAPRLERLRITDAPLTDADLEALAAAPRLRLLTLQGCPQLRGSGLAALAETGIEQLELGWNLALEPAALTSLAAWPGLRRLGLRGVSLRDWTFLDGLRQLAALDLSSCQGLDEAAFRALGAIPGLADLRLTATPHADQPLGDGRWLRHLVGLRELRRLDLGYHDLGVEDQREGLLALARLPRLEALDLSSWELSEADQATLQAFPALRWLCCDLWGDSQQLEQPLLELPQVTSFRPYTGIEPFTESVPNLGAWVALTRLDLRSSDETGDGSLRALEGVPQLEWLLLDAAQVTDAGLRPMLGCPRLQVLSLRRCDRLSPDVVEVLVRLRELQVLDLRDCPWVDDAVLERLTRLERLRCVLLRGTHVSAAGVEALRRARPGCLIAGGA